MYVIYYTDSQQLLSEVSSKYIDLHPARKQTDMLSSMVSKMMGVQSEPQGASANAQIKIKQLPRPAAPKLKVRLINNQQPLLTLQLSPRLTNWLMKRWIK